MLLKSSLMPREIYCKLRRMLRNWKGELKKLLLTLSKQTSNSGRWEPSAIDEVSEMNEEVGATRIITAMINNTC